MDRMLSHDPTLRAVADLFALPPPGTPRAPRQPRVNTARKPIPRFSRLLLSIVTVAFVALIGALIAASLTLTVVALAAIGTAIGTGLAAVIVAARLGRDGPLSLFPVGVRASDGRHIS